MAAKDIFHDAVKRALEKDAWTIIHAPLIFQLRWGQYVRRFGGRKNPSCHLGDEKIAVEIQASLALPQQLNSMPF